MAWVSHSVTPRPGPTGPAGTSAVYHITIHPFRLLVKRVGAPLDNYLGVWYLCGMAPRVNRIEAIPGGEFWTSVAAWLGTHERSWSWLARKTGFSDSYFLLLRQGRRPLTPTVRAAVEQHTPGLSDA